MQKLLGILISFQLLVLPLPSLAIDEKYRENLRDEMPPTSEPVSTDGYGDDDTVHGKSYKEELSQAKDTGYSFYTLQPLAYSLSLLGMSLPLGCRNPLIPSVAAFIAGSGVFIFSEIEAAQKQRERHLRLMEELKEVQEGVIVGEVQLEAIKKKIEEEEHLRDFIAKRIRRMRIVQLMYGAATGLSIAEEVVGNAAAATVATPICAGIASTLCAGLPPCIGIQMPACMFAHTTGHQAAKAFPPFWSAPSIVRGTTACAATGPYSPACTAALNPPGYLLPTHPYCSALSTTLISSMINIVAVSVAFKTDFSDFYKTNHEYHVLFPKLLTVMVPAVAGTFTLFLNYPLHRTVAFAAATAIIGKVISGLSKRKSMVERNIQNFNKVLTQFKKDSKADNALADRNGPKIPKPDVTPRPEILVSQPDIPKSPDDKMKCFSKNGTSLEYSKNGCVNPLEIPRGSPYIGQADEIHRSIVNEAQAIKGVSVIGRQEFSRWVSTLDKAGTLSHTIATSLNTGKNTEANVAMAELGKIEADLNAAVSGLKKSYDQIGKAKDKNYRTIDERTADLLMELEKVHDAIPEDLKTKIAASSSGQNPIKKAGAVEKSAKSPTPDPVSSTVSPPPPPLTGNSNSYAQTADAKTATELANAHSSYNRNRDEFEPTPEDGLFKIVSKAYVRNLEKFLTKKIEESP